MTRRPNLFVVGAMKAGTTTLHSLLAQHPEIYMSRIKEPRYFVAPDGCVAPPPFATAYTGNRRAYLRLFASAGAAKYVGESSPAYTRLPAIHGVAERIRQFSGEASIIYILRDPVARSISHYWFNVQHDAERRGIYEAICSDEQYRDVSNYAMQLMPYLDQFGTQRIHVMTLERLVADRRSSLRNVFSWLGVDASFVPPSLGIHANPTAEVVRIPAGRGRLDAFRFSPAWGAVGRFVPRQVRVWGLRLAYKFVNRADVPTHKVVEYLRSVQREQVRELCRLLGRGFPEWTMLEPAVAEEDSALTNCQDRK